MDSRPARKVQILDLLIVVAAAAVGLTAVRYYVKTPASLIPTFDARGVVSFIPARRAIALRESATIGSLALAALSPALLWVWFRSPGMNALAMLQRPGVAAAVIATAGVVAYLGWHLRAGWPTIDVPAVNRGGQEVTGTIDLLPEFVLDKLRQTVGPAVVATWMLFFVAKGRRRISADWIDHSGLVLALAWLLLSIESLR